MVAVKILKHSLNSVRPLLRTLEEGDSTVLESLVSLAAVLCANYAGGILSHMSRKPASEKEIDLRLVLRRYG